ncbi:MAG: CAP domain-containing protein [Planctomycetota bacterium]
MNYVKNTFFSIGLLAMAVTSLGWGATAAAREPSFILSQGSVDGVAGADGSVISQTNAARARHGLPPLAVDSQLMNSARNHAQWMASNRNLSHGHGVAENIAMGQASAGEAVRSWMNSSGHRANMLGSGYTRIGVAVAYSSNGTPYWCQQFR